MLPGKRPGMAILPSEIVRFTQIWFSKFFTYCMTHYFKLEIHACVYLAILSVLDI